jgi:hypothetical protein
MPNVNYKINHPVAASVLTWAQGQSGYVTMEQTDTYVQFTFNHADAAAETAFKELLAAQINLDGENVNISDADLTRTFDTGDTQTLDGSVEFDGQVSFTDQVGFDSGQVSFSVGLTSLSISKTCSFGNGADLSFGTSSGTKIGTGTTQKLGFYNATPIVQPAANADTSGATLGDLETEVNQIKQLLRNLGLMAT